MFTKQELQSIGMLIGRADIKGQEAMAVAVLLQKIDREIGILEEINKPKLKEEKEDGGK